MKNLIVLFSFIFLILCGCTQNQSFEDTKSFFYKHQDTLSKIVQILEGQKNKFSIHYNRYMVFNGNTEKGFEITFSNESPGSVFETRLKSNFSSNDSNFILIKEKYNVNFLEIKKLCEIIEKLEIPSLDYFEPGLVTLLNLKYKKGGYPKIPEDYKQISGDWYYYKIKDPL